MKKLKVLQPTSMRTSFVSPGDVIDIYGNTYVAQLGSHCSKCAFGWQASDQYCYRVPCNGRIHWELLEDVIIKKL